MSKAALILLSLIILSSCTSRTEYYLRNTTEEELSLEIYFNEQLRAEFDSPGWVVGGIMYEKDSNQIKPNEMDIRRYSERENFIQGLIVADIKTVYRIPDSSILQFADQEGLKLFVDSIKLVLPDTSYLLQGDRKCEVEVQKGGFFNRWICYVL